ncbi:Wadjet anti-phage system protein JetD domain-containing protein, partial [Phascolarctobacterium succinatutens]|uniref:Wadjet anti-phage system protein JetD domain-containing protein n=1 Tax=Phascolarctobacterium succinatutens TaxID=626940 RepID=UPI003A932461
MEEVLGSKINAEYSEQHAYIMELVDSGRIKPVLASKKNGKKPALYREYWKLEQKQDYSALKQELLFNLASQIDITYYQHNLQTYDKERKDVLLLSSFLQNSATLLTKQVSYNERSFQIWQKEKFLLQGAGKKILSHCSLELAQLNCYSTAEPFAYFASTRAVPQKLLIIENKDTFFSMRKHLLAGNSQLLGENISTIIYGAGKRVVSYFQEFNASAEPYMLAEGNELLYFGDLDYEGIGIYEKLAASFAE